MKNKIIFILSALAMFILTRIALSQEKLIEQPQYFYSSQPGDVSEPKMTTTPDYSGDNAQTVELAKQLSQAKLNNDAARIKELEKKISELSNDISIEFVNDPDITGYKETSHTINPQGNGVTVVGTGPFWAIATQTSNHSNMIFTAVTEYNSAGGDKLKIFVSYDQGVSCILKGLVQNFNTGLRFYNDELDIEPIITDNDTLLYVVAGYVYNGKRCTMIGRCDIETGTVNLQTFSLSSQTTKNYGPRITSDNSRYKQSPYVYITVANDSLKSANNHSLKQRFCIITNPLQPVFTQTHRIANSSGGFCWGLSNATDTTWMWQDVAFYHDGINDFVYTSCIFRGYNNVYNAWSKTYGSSVTNSMIIQEGMPTSKVKLAFNGANYMSGTLIYLRNYTSNPNGDVDIRSHITINGGQFTYTYYPGWIDLSTDTAVSCDVQAIKGAFDKYKYAFSVKGSKCYYLSNTGSATYSIRKLVNNIPAGMDYGRVRAGYRITSSDSCLAVWSGNSGGNMYSTYGCMDFTGIEPKTESGIPNGFELAQNYPNPFNPVTTIKFSMPAMSHVKLTVFDITGKELDVLIDKQMNAGNYNVSFDASKLSSGVYFYRLVSGDFSKVMKMVLVK